MTTQGRRFQKTSLLPALLLDGETVSQAHAAAINDLSRQTVEVRVKRGWPLVAALILPAGEINPHRNRPARGIYAGQTAERWAVLMPNHLPGAILPPEFYAPDGRRWLDVARAGGIPYPNFYVRVRTGWSPERAATEPVVPRGPRGPRPFGLSGTGSP